DAYLSRGRSLGQARLLWEIGREGAEIRSLRARLDLDSGYLSRLLQALQADGLVDVSTDPAHARVRRGCPTAPGLAERTELDHRSDELATSMLAPLTADQRDRLVAAMTEVERLLIASTVRVEVTDVRTSAARECIRAYFAELARRFDGGFDSAHTLPT